MVRPSNPKLMAKVLDAVTYLAENKGSLTRDILNFVKRNSSGPKRNLTMQIQRALKHAVNAGLLRCKSGRYKMQFPMTAAISHNQRLRQEDDKKSRDKTQTTKNPTSEDPTDLSQKVQDRRKRPSRKKRTARKTRERRRSATRSTRRKATKRRRTTVTVVRKTARKSNKRIKRKRKNDDEIEEDWPTRRRRMMNQSSFDDDDDDDDKIRSSRKSPNVKGVNEDSASNISGDSESVGRHRSRRSKHLAKDRRSPSRRGNGDSEGHRKSTRRSTSRRRSQQRHRENRREFAPERQREGISDGEMGNEGMELDDNRQGHIERRDTPPKNQENE